MGEDVGAVATGACVAFLRWLVGFPIRPGRTQTASSPERDWAVREIVILAALADDRITPVEWQVLDRLPEEDDLHAIKELVGRLRRELGNPRQALAHSVWRRARWLDPSARADVITLVRELARVAAKLAKEDRDDASPRLVETIARAMDTPAGAPAVLDRLAAALERYAGAHGGTSDGRIAVIEQDGVKLELGLDDTWLQGTLMTGVTRYRVGIGPVFKVVPRTSWHALAELVWLEGEDVTLGNEARPADLDDPMIVRTRERDATKRAWTRTAQRRAIGLLQSRAFWSDGETIRAHVRESEPTALPGVMDVIRGVLVDLARFAIEDWNALAAIEGARIAVDATTEDGVTPLPVLEIDRLRGVVRAGTRRGLPPGAFAAWIDWPHGDDVSIPAPRAELGAMRFSIADGTFRAVWPEWPKARELTAAADQLDVIRDAAPSQGAYR